MGIDPDVGVGVGGKFAGPALVSAGGGEGRQRCGAWECPLQAEATAKGAGSGVTE